MKTLCRIFALCLVLVVCLSMIGCGGSPKKTALRIYNWGDYINPDVLETFKKENPDIDVIYDTFDSNESMLAKLDGGAKYDILVPSDYMVEKLIADNRLMKLDKSKMKNFDKLDPAFLNMSFDPDNSYSVPYTWGTLGILYNTKLVEEEVDSWGVLFDNKNKGKIVMYDSVRDSMAVALKYLGYSCNDRDVAHLNEAGALLKQQKSIIKAYMLDNIKETMISGSTAYGVVYSGDAIVCMEENEDLAYVVPKEGSNLFVDNIVIAKDCQNPDAAYRFIDYLCDANVAAQNYEYVGYPTANKGAVEIMGEEYTSDPVNNPGEEVLKKCEIYLDLGSLSETYNQIWQNIKLQ